MAHSVESTDTPAAKDYLSVDPDVPGQKFFCVSFVSPEKVLKTKTEFALEHFWKWFKQQKVVNLADIDIWEQYQIFMLKEEEAIEKAFHKENEFQTTIRGLKVRGVYETEEEARVRCQVLQRIDKTHSVFVAPIGYWVPWDPTPDGVPDQVYQERQLNDLMQHYNSNEQKRDQYYEQQKQDRAQAAMAESEKRRVDGGGAEASNGAVNVATVIDGLERSADHADFKEEFNQFKTS